MDKIIPIVKFDIDEDMKSSGVKAISLVDQPAIESNFKYFNKQEKKSNYIQLSGYEGVVAGLALIPDKEILRFDSAGNPFFGYFTVEVIKKLRNKFHKELMTNNVNTDHNDKNFIDAYLIESFLIDDEYKLESVKSKGIEEATLGSWFVSYKVDDPETFKRVVSGELNGFSIEVSLQSFYKVNQNKETKLEKIMKKYVTKFQELLEEMKNEQTLKLEIVKIKDSVDQIEYNNVGEPVSIILPDGSKKAADAREYMIEGDKVVVVGDGGLMTEIKDAMPVVPPAEGELPVVNVPVVEEPKVEVEITPEGEVSVEKPEEVVVPVVDEAPVANPEVDAMKAEIASLKENVSAKDAEIASLKAEVAKLKGEPLTNPASADLKKKEVLSKVELSRLSTVERIALENGYSLPNKFKSKK